MGRIRTIKPGFWTHEELSELPPETHMLAAALLNYADDEGYFNANPKLIKAECCPLREDSMNVHESIIELSKVGYLALGTGNDRKRYGRIVKFDEHQRVNRPNESKIKRKSICWHESLNNHGLINDDSLPEGKGREEEREKERNINALFDKWYSVYPSKKAKQEARKAWGAAKPGRDDTAKFIRAVRLQKRWRAAMAEFSPNVFVPLWKHPATWLRSGSFDDELDWPVVPAGPQCPVNEIVSTYHEILPELPPVVGKPNGRAGPLIQRWLEQPAHQTIQFWRKFFQHVRTSDFLMGRTEERFKANFDWLVKHDNFYKSVTEQYHHGS